MALRESEALVLRTYDYGDTSQVVHLLTPDSGRIHVLAKGSRRDRNAFQGSIDLLVHGRAAWYHRPRTGLHLLGSFEVLDTFPRIRRDLDRYFAASHVLEALHESTHQEEAGENAFRLALATLRVVERSREPARVLPVFHADLLRLLGLAPRLDACVVCDAPAASIRRPRLDAAHGGLLCEECAGRAPAAADVAPDALAVIRALFDAPFREGVRLDLPERLRGPVASVLAQLLRHVLERDLPTLRWVRTAPEGP